MGWISAVCVDENFSETDQVCNILLCKQRGEDISFYENLGTHVQDLTNSLYLMKCLLKA